MKFHFSCISFISNLSFVKKKPTKFQQKDFLTATSAKGLVGKNNIPDLSEPVLSEHFFAALEFTYLIFNFNRIFILNLIYPGTKNPGRLINSSDI